MNVRFNLRRLDGSLELDTIGLDVPADRIATETRAGAIDLILEAMREGKPLVYESYEVTTADGVKVCGLAFSQVIG